MRALRRIGYYASLTLLTAIRKARSLLWRLGGRGPISGARIVILSDKGVLLVRHYLAPWVWTLPGGGIEPGESSDDAADREVKEETGLNVHSKKKIGAFPLERGGETHVYYTSDFDGKVSPTVKFEIMECRWFPIDRLPEEFFARDRAHVEKYLHMTTSKV